MTGQAGGKQRDGAAELTPVVTAGDGVKFVGNMARVEDAGELSSGGEQPFLVAAGNEEVWTNECGAGWDGPALLAE
jgi:hypothetical protein